MRKSIVSMIKRNISGIYKHFGVDPSGLPCLFQVSDGHFIQFFAPSNLSPLPKNIVFVIDVSGSMWGVKMKQVRSEL